MKALLLHSTQSNDTLGLQLYHMLTQTLQQRGWRTETLDIAGMKIAPCIGCFNCWVKTPGICAQNDDGRQVDEAIAHCNALVFLSPVTFGGYSSRLKMAVDRIIPTISPLFEKYQGEMRHQLRYKPPHSFLALGWQEKRDEESAKVFGRIAARNALNMHAPFSGSAVLHKDLSPEEREAQVEQLADQLEGRS